MRFWSGVESGVEYYEIFKAKMHATLNSNMFVEILQCSGENYINTYAFNWYCMNLKILNKIHFNETDIISLVYLILILNHIRMWCNRLEIGGIWTISTKM